MTELLTEDHQPESSVVELRPEETDANQRLDRYLAEHLPGYSRTMLSRLIDSGDILVDGYERRASFKVTPGETVVVTLPHIEPVEIVPEDIPLDILYEDADVIVLDKRAGMVVHPGPSHERGTLVNALLFHHPSMDFGDTERPGIVHRLDKDTSGVMVVAKHPDAAQALMDQWRHGAVQKHYIAVVAGVLSEDEAVVDVPIARHGSDRKRMAVDRSGRQALTIARVRERLDSATLLDVDLKTGRTHQIRVHLSYIGHPVLGDTVYGTSPSRERSKKLDIARQLLHAHTLTFTPPSRNEATTFTSPIPRDMVGAVSRLRESDQEGASIEPGIAY